LDILERLMWRSCFASAHRMDAADRAEADRREGRSGCSDRRQD
jgi:hypothetical protein